MQRKTTQTKNIQNGVVLTCLFVFFSTRQLLSKTASFATPPLPRPWPSVPVAYPQLNLLSYTTWALGFRNPTRSIASWNSSKGSPIGPFSLDLSVDRLLDSRPCDSDQDDMIDRRRQKIRQKVRYISQFRRLGPASRSQHQSMFNFSFFNLDVSIWISLCDFRVVFCLIYDSHGKYA